MIKDTRLPLFPRVMPGWFKPLVIAIIISAVSFVALFFASLSYLRRSPVIQQTLQICQQDTEMIRHLGEPMKMGLMVMGETGETKDGNTVSSRLFNIKGPHGFAACRCHGILLENGQWEVIFIQVSIDGQETLDGSGWRTILGDLEDMPRNLSDERRDEVRENGLPRVPYTDSGAMDQEEISQREQEALEQATQADDTLPIEDTP